MSNKEKFEILKRNTVEIVTNEELKKIIRTKQKPMVYCGFEPSGPIHLGHLVTIRKLLDLQRIGFKVKVLLADLHAFLNKKGEEEFIQKQVRDWKKGIKAIGLDNAKFIKGRSFEYSRDFINDLHEIALETTINRGLRSMQEIARDIDNAKISQIIYPLMQVVDIKHLQVDVALGGMEQRKIHMLARETLPDIGYKAPIAIHTPLITSLKGSESKMSSSIEGSFIEVTDSRKAINEKIMGAFCPQGEINHNPVIEITKYLLLPQFGEVTLQRKEEYGGDIILHSAEEINNRFKNGEIHPKDLKKNVARLLNNMIEPIRTAFK